MSINSNNLNGNSPNLNLLEDWFRRCTELDNLGENVDKERLERLVEDLTKKDDLVNLIYQLLENASYHEQYLERICKHLFKLYLTKLDDLQVFVLSFVPSLIGINLTNSLDSKLKKLHKFLDVFLISIYNFSLINEDGTIKERSFRLPNLNKSSIYHSPEINNDLSEIAIRKLEKCYKENRILYVQDNIDLHSLNATNRMIVYCSLVQTYHDTISRFTKRSLIAFCRMCNSILFYNSNNIDSLKLINIKFDLNTSIDYADILNKSRPKLQLSSNFLLQLLNCLYFCIYNGVEKEGRICIVEIHSKAMSHLYTDVLLMTNAIFNSLSISKQSLENECMGINMSFSLNSEITTNTGQTKSAITNASFKTQKLPEDIEIKNDNLNNLNAIVEEANENDKSYNLQQPLLQQQSVNQAKSLQQQSIGQNKLLQQQQSVNQAKSLQQQQSIGQNKLLQQQQSSNQSKTLQQQRSVRTNL